MPKFLEMFGWRFFAVMHDLVNEPFHIHVTDKGKKVCKYWVVPEGHMQLADNRGFSVVERNKIERAIRDNLPNILDQYNTYCNEKSIRPNYKNIG